MGYTKNEDGDLVIVPEEAEIVKLIFRLYLEGYSTGKIAKHLEEQGIKTATGQDKWHSTVIDKMLRNEKYMGDALLQKTYTVDFMTKKKVKNTGIVPQYYVEDDHEAIIPKELFYRVQEEMVALIAENAKTGSYTLKFDERYRTIAEEINVLKEAQKTARNEKRMADSYEQRIQDIDHYLSTSTCQIPEFDNDLVRRLISTIKVESSEKLLIQFQSGIVMEQEIRYE